MNALQICNLFYLKFWIKLTALERNRRFFIFCETFPPLMPNVLQINNNIRLLKN